MATSWRCMAESGAGGLQSIAETFQKDLQNCALCLQRCATGRQSLFRAVKHAVALKTKKSVLNINLVLSCCAAANDSITSDAA